MKRAFSLVEVIIATVIISLVGLALLQMGSKHQKMDAYIEKKSALAQYTSVISYQHTTDFNRLDKTLFDFLKNDFDIDNIEIKQMLEKEKFYYVETKVTNINFGENNESADEKQTQSFELKKAIIKKSDITSSILFLEY